MQVYVVLTEGRFSPSWLDEETFYSGLKFGSSFRLNPQKNDWHLMPQISGYEHITLAEH